MTPESELAQLTTVQTLSPAVDTGWVEELRAIVLFVPCAIAFLLVSATVLAFALLAGAMVSPAIALVAAWWMARHDRAVAAAQATAQAP